jgi:hypothetical protein
LAHSNHAHSAGDRLDYYGLSRCTEDSTYLLFLFDDGSQDNNGRYSKPRDLPRRLLLIILLLNVLAILTENHNLLSLLLSPGVGVDGSLENFVDRRIAVDQVIYFEIPVITSFASVIPNFSVKRNQPTTHLHS